LYLMYVLVNTYLLIIESMVQPYLPMISPMDHMIW